MKLNISTVLLAVAMGLCAQRASAQSYSIDWHTIGGGGGTSAGGGFALSGTIGQPDAGEMGDGEYTISGGFWSIEAAVPPVVATTIFDNTTGVFNGLLSASTTSWLAGRFCVGPQPYTLDSVALLLNSGDNNRAHVSTVRLQIYSDKVGSSRPSVSMGPTLNLSGLTNPITLSIGFADTLVTWSNAMPFKLSANTCYWLVLSVESGDVVYATVSQTQPTGDAGAFGWDLSPDTGATWGAPDLFDNLKMLIRATPVSIPSVAADLAANESTAIPGGTGNFTSLPLAPSLSGNNLVFYGAGSGGQQGIYLQNRLIPPNPIRIADLNTPIPNGSGNFVSLGTEAGIIIVGGDILFSGRGSGTQQGVYLASLAILTDPVRIADTATGIPSGIGTFTAFQNALGFSGSDVAFVGSGSGGQQGIYAVAVLAPPQVGSPLRVADTAMAIPGGSGNFTLFPSGPALSGREVAFIGNGSDGQQGLYKVAVLTPPQVGSPLRIADTAMAIPGGIGTFTAFGSDQAHPVDPAMNGDRLAFVGSGSGGQQGVYAVGVLGPPQAGPFRLADLSTPIPGGSGTFTSFGAVSVSETDLAFLGHGAGGQTGIYDLTAGQLLKVIAVGDRLGGKAITGLGFSRGGLFGDPVSFQATFSDGSQGVYIIDVVPPPELRISAAEGIGNDLRLSFTSESGSNYTVQSRGDLGAGGWLDVAGTPTLPGTGATLQVLIPNAFTETRRFYRVKQSP